MAKPKKINWEVIKTEYISNKGASLKLMAQRFKISYSYIKRVSSRENWIQEKENRWEESERKAIEKVGSSITDLIVRHAKIARFLQAGGLRELKKKFQAMELDSEKAEKVTLRDLLALVSEGLKAERELYPKQIQLEKDSPEEVGISKELKEAVYETLKKKLRTKRKTGELKN